MTRPTDEARKLRIRDDHLADDLARRPFAPAFGSPSLVARTTSLKAYPTAAQRFFAMVPVAVLGTEAEGGAGVFSAGTSAFLALNLGTVVPPSGTNLVVTFVDSRWVFRYDG